jgi:hypothetical protein
VTQATGLPLVIEEEPSLSEGQVYIRFGTAETKVDLDRVTSDIANAVRGVLQPQNLRMQSHG